MEPHVGSWTLSHFAILVLASLSTFGANYMHDTLNVLQPVMTGKSGCHNASAGHTECCHDCLGVGDQDYNMIHAVLFWTCAISLLASGFLLDKLGNWIIVLLACSTFIGACIIAIGAGLGGTAVAVKPMLFIGTLFRGAGYLTSLVARARIISGWFLGKEIGCAFGAASAINRIGSIPCYTLTEVLREAVGLPTTLWVGACVCLFSVLCAVAVALLDSCTEREDECLKADRRAVNLKDVAEFSADYWLLIAVIGLYSGVFRTTQANGTELVHEKFGYSKEMAAIVTGEMLYMSVILSPLIGLLLDKTGGRGYAILLASLLHIPALVTLGFTDLTPIVGCFAMGIAFCCFTSVLMSSVPLLVDKCRIGMATALAQFSSTICTGVVHAALGEILGRVDSQSPRERRHRWQLSVAFILGVALTAAALAAALVAFSIATDGVLTRKRSQGTKAVEVEVEDKAE